MLLLLVPPTSTTETLPLSKLRCKTGLCRRGASDSELECIHWPSWCWGQAGKRRERRELIRPKFADRALTQPYSSEMFEEAGGFMPGPVARHNLAVEINTETTGGCPKAFYDRASVSFGKIRKHVM